MIRQQLSNPPVGTADCLTGQREVWTLGIVGGQWQRGTVGKETCWRKGHPWRLNSRALGLVRLLGEEMGYEQRYWSESQKVEV